jgi:hypothetical protein
MISYFERNGARPCNQDENPAEWVLDVTSSTEKSNDSQDLSESWEKSPECKTIKKKLAHLREKFPGSADLLDGSNAPDAVQQSTPGFDAMALQRKSKCLVTRQLSYAYGDLGAFYKYRCLENMKLPAASPIDHFASLGLFYVDQPILHEEKEHRDIAPIPVRPARFYQLDHGKVY